MGHDLRLDLDNYVRVTQTTGADLTGRYDGVDYVFPDGEPVDVAKPVAMHIFGFMLPEKSDDPRVQDKIPALLRLGWVDTSGSIESGLETLRTRVKFEEIPPFPTVLRFRQPEENTGATQVELPEGSPSRVPSSPALGGGAGPGTASPADPAPRKTLGLPKMTKA